MNTLRNELKSKYSQIPNELITDLELCNGSLRVILYLFTKPDNWNVYNKDICNQLSISEQTLTKYWKKLLNSKWLQREPSRDKEGKLTGGYTYRIGNFTVSIQSTETVKSIDHSNNKPLNKEVTNIHYDDFLEIWNEFAATTKKPRVMKLSSVRKKKISQRCKDFKDFKEALKIALGKAKVSTFLKEGSFFDFDWLIDNDNNIVKVIEDKYKNKEVTYK